MDKNGSMSNEPIRIYMDTCCLNRPFDDQTRHRIRLETEAVLEILENVPDRLRLVSSTVTSFEISRIPEGERRSNVRELYSVSSTHVEMDVHEYQRAEELESFGFDPMDALHLAAAEAVADVFLTTDDRIIRTAEVEDAKEVDVEIANPVDWYFDQLTHE